MGTDWSRIVLFGAELTFAALFVRSLISYLLRRDPLLGNITLLFLPPTVLTASTVTQMAPGIVPAWVTPVAVAILLTQPCLTVRLAARLRSVPRRLELLVWLIWVFVAGARLFTGITPSNPVLALVVTVFLAGECVAAGLLIGKARRRTGANKARLMIAATATLAFGGMVALSGLGTFTHTPALTAGGRTLAVISALGYLVAFAPPRWLRRVFSAVTVQRVTERLLRAPVESPEQVWQIYAEIMRVQTGADAVGVLMPRPDGQLATIGYSGPPLPRPDDLANADLTALIRADRPARLRESSPALVAHYGDDLTDDFVTVLSMPVPPDVDGAVLLFNRHRTLFSDEDLRLLAALGGQAGILAERQAVMNAQRRLSDELSASVEALTRASQAKSTFLANMSHELRTPLNAIIGFSDLMRLEEPDGDRRRVPAEWVEHIHTSGRHLLGLINDILDLAKVEAGRLDLRLAPLRIDTAVTELLTGLAPLITTKQLNVDSELREATALADRVRFRQIVENLLSNAIKFTPEGGTLTITTRPLGEDSVEVIVDDTGIGIAPADQIRVFEEFQQAGDDEGRRAGTGLGLALTKWLVEAHEGEISLVSAPGQGSSFRVRLPAAPVLRVVPDVDGGDHTTPRVLLIEDDPQSAELLSTQLGAAGYRVDVAGSGEHGLAAAGTHPPDAIVLDVTLPGIDGWEVIRRLKADTRLAGIPVFFASIVDDRQAGLALGARDYFVKPVDQAALLGALAQTLADRSSPRVLVVDHDDQVRVAIEEGLRAGGADVVACAEARDGLERSRAEHFDLIVCDMQTTDVDGFSLMAAIAEESAHTPVLGITAASGADPADAVPLVATAMAGGVLAEAMAGGAGWETLAPLLGRRSQPRNDT
ncbi:response regulator [Actinoplanes sp. NPDC049265]|uniref:response regulator n=1 Tax=Actinoplanes sp. NPDC049265 TaxID=3363902 RepID=UPI00371DDA48